LSLTQAQALAHRAIDAYAQRFSKYAPTCAWPTENQAEITFTVKTMELRGGLTVMSDRFVIWLDVPLLLRPFQRRAVHVIDDEVRGWLAKVK
jgi:hypothetical protein